MSTLLMALKYGSPRLAFDGPYVPYVQLWYISIFRYASTNYAGLRISSVTVVQVDRSPLLE
jgi:hypothetical protein